MKSKTFWYFIATFEDDTKNAEWKLSKYQAKALYDYHIKNMLLLKVKSATFGSYRS